MKKHEYFMRLAIEEAKRAKGTGNLACGAVIVLDSRVIGTGKAEDKTTGDVTHHAEVLAIKEACRHLKSNDLSQCMIYTTVEPCLMCASTIFQAGIGKIIIGVSREDLSSFLRPRQIRIHQLVKDLGYSPQILEGILKNEILCLFKFYNKLNSI